MKMGCKPRHYPRRASRVLFLDNNYVHQANGSSDNDIKQVNGFSVNDIYEANGFSDNNINQANSFSDNNIYQANSFSDDGSSASSDCSLSLSMIDEEIVDDDFCEWIVRELSHLVDGSAHLERANHSLNLTDGPGVVDASAATAVSFVDIAAINSPMPQVSNHANSGAGTVIIVTQQY
jgi:hypothetical protein